MHISRIDLWHVAIPLRAPFFPSWIPGFRQEENRFDLIRLTTTGGLKGWSAMPSMGRERAGWGQILGSYFLGERADDLAGIRQRVREMGFLGHRGGGLIEPACWDIVGKARNKPVYELLGGGPGQIKLYASTGQVRTGAERVAEISSRLEEGFDCVKLRVHDETLEQDVAQIRAAREAHPTVRLGVDANMGWRVAAIADCASWDYDRALAFCRAAAELDYAWVEEPLPQDDYQGLARLTAETEVTIAGGELNNQGLPELSHMIERRCYDWFQPDAVMVGGIAETVAIARRATAAGLSYSPHTWTNGIGFAINLQVFGGIGDREKHLEYPLDPPGWTVEGRDGLLARPFTHEGGKLSLPTAPGLGIEIDPAQLSRFGTHFYTATKLRVALSTVWDRGISLAKHLGAVRQERLSQRALQLDALEAGGEDVFLDPLRRLALEGD